MSQIINFDYFDLNTIIGIAERRNIVKVVAGVKSKRYDKNQTDFETHINGVMGEAAVAKYLKIKLDKNVSLSGDDKISDLIKNGNRIQVKTTLFKNGALFFDSKSLFKADVSVSVAIISPVRVDIQGWIDKETFLNKAEKMNFGYGDRWGIQPNKLNDIAKLNDYLEIRKEQLV